MTGAPEVLADGAALGDRFVAQLGIPSGPGWVGVDDLFGPATVTAVGTARGTTNPAVAATLLFEQYAQRLVAPVLAALYRDRALLDARLPRIRARVEDGVLRRLAFAAAPEPAAPEPAAPEPAGGPDIGPVLDRLVAGNLGPAADLVHHRHRAGTRVLRGAMANAVAGSLLHLSWPDPDRAVHVGDARAWLERVPGWAGLVDVAAVETLGERWMYVRRETCCLAFRTTVNQAREQRYCSSCPVLPRSTTVALFERATAAYAARFPH